MLDRVRMWLRERGIGERRWIADMSEREVHRLAVRGRLARPVFGEAADTDTDDEANDKADDEPGDAAPSEREETDPTA